MTETIKRGDVVWIYLPPAQFHFIQEGKRPAIVVQNDTGNTHSSTTIVVPITSVLKRRDLVTHVPINADFLPNASMALCEQIVTVNKDQIQRVIGHLPKAIMQTIDLGILRSVLTA